MSDADEQIFKIERDTDNDESISDDEFKKLLYPLNSSTNPMFLCSKLCIAFEMDRFRAWVKQPSPSCAAASVAGAWNILNGYGRDHDNALSVYHVLEYYAEMMEQKIEKQRNSITRILGASIEQFDHKVVESLQESGLEFGV